MSRGPGTHQREILRRLDERGWIWASDLPFRSRSDYGSYWRAIHRLEQRGALRVEYRTRTLSMRRWVLLVSVNQVSSAPALPINEPYWPKGHKFYFAPTTTIDVEAVS